MPAIGLLQMLVSRKNGSCPENIVLHTNVNGRSQNIQNNPGAFYGPKGTEMRLSIRKTLHCMNGWCWDSAGLSFLALAPELSRSSSISPSTAHWLSQTFTRDFRLLLALRLGVEFRLQDSWVQPETLGSDTGPALEWGKDNIWKAINYPCTWDRPHE